MHVYFRGASLFVEDIVAWHTYARFQNGARSLSRRAAARLAASQDEVEETISRRNFSSARSRPRLMRLALSVAAFLGAECVRRFAARREALPR